MSLLFVDDEAGLLGIYEDELAYYLPEVKVYTAENGNEALQIYEKNKPLLVFTDGRMPEMDGLELAQKLSQFSEPPRVFMITGHFGSMSDKPEFDGVIEKVFHKPIDFEELLSFIKSLL